ncbi:MAG: pilin [Patescibacteria group bacterium]|nr:pilin [Patescibacteria group bacterium]
MFVPSVFAAEATPASWSARCATNEVATIQGLECVFQNIVSVALALAGLAVFLMLLAGGLKYLTSGGDPKAQESAKNTLTYAILGLVLMVAAFLILSLIANFTGLKDSLLNFTIPGGN